MHVRFSSRTGCVLPAASSEPVAGRTATKRLARDSVCGLWRVRQKRSIIHVIIVKFWRMSAWRRDEHTTCERIIRCMMRVDNRASFDQKGLALLLLKKRRYRSEGGKVVQELKSTQDGKYWTMLEEVGWILWRRGSRGNMLFI